MSPHLSSLLSLLNSLQLSMASQNVLRDVVVDRKLLDARFDGYKLCLDSLPISELSLGIDVDLTKLSTDLYSYQHLKLYGVENRLHADPWDDKSVWFINCNWEIMRAQLTPPHGLHLSNPKLYYTLPQTEEFTRKENRISVSMNFCSEEWLIISDGAGRLIILKTIKRSEENSKYEEWYNGRPLEGNIVFKIYNSEYHSGDNKHYIEILCAHIANNPLAEKNMEASNFVTCLEWLTLSSVSEKQFELIRRRQLQTFTGPDYAAITGDGCKVVICSEKPVKFSFDSSQPVPTERENSKSESQPLFTWTQKGREIVIYIKMNDNTSTSDLLYKLTCDHLELKLIKSDEYILCGQLFDNVLVDQCTWTLTDKAFLEIHLKKVDEEKLWSEVIKGDKRGQIVLDEQLAVINEQLAPFTSDFEDIEEKKQTFNTQQLEECDMSDVSLVMYCFDGCSHKIEEQINLSSHQWLFTSRMTSSNLPFICIRHDVDGLVLKIGPTCDTFKSMWKHVATFNAFGYVQASKQQRKFTVCAPNFSYVAIVDFSKHIFLYRQPSASTLKSRKTGENVRVAKQQMITLDPNETTEGAVATDNKLFVLTKQHLYCIRINSD